jgi:5-methylthioribose kinase
MQICAKKVIVHLCDGAAGCAQRALQVYLFDASSSIIVMELLAAPNVILRHAIVKGGSYPCVGRHTGEFLAATLFNTSLLAMDTRSFR